MVRVHTINLTPIQGIVCNCAECIRKGDEDPLYLSDIFSKREKDSSNKILLFFCWVLISSTRTN